MIIDHCSVLARDFYLCQCIFFVSITRDFKLLFSRSQASMSFASMYFRVDSIYLVLQFDAIV